MSKRPTQSNYHIPVLLEESVNALIGDPNGVYVDATFGGGGHSKAVLKRITAKGRLFGFDQDEKALEQAPDDPRLTLIHANYRFFKHFMRYYAIDKVDGILADLGVSSHHFDDPARGFSYRYEGPLDMRMNRLAEIDASHILNTYGEAKLQDIFSKYGEIRNSKTLAKAIVRQRQQGPINRTESFLEIVDRYARGDKMRYRAQAYQALRIEVNDELNALEEFLVQGRDWLVKDGRFVVITYHSVEDRWVKNFFRTGNVAGREMKDDFGHRIVAMKELTKKPIVPTEEEKLTNRRSMSAKMRIAENL